MKLYILLASTLLLTASVQAQDETAAPDSTPKKNTLTIGAVYANNADYYGQKAAEKTPYVALAGTWHLKPGLYFTGLAYRLLNDTAGIASATALGIGWDFKLSKRLTADLSYSHTFYPSYSPFIQAANPNNASISLTYDNWVAVKLTGDYAFGKTHDGFVTAGLSKSVTLGHFSDKDLITLTPNVYVVGGTQHFYETYVTEKRVRDSLLGNVLSPILGSPSQGGTTTTTKTVSSTSFDLLSYNMKLPLAYNRSSYMIELAYQLSVLSNKAQSNPGKSNSFFTASFYYQF